MNYRIIRSPEMLTKIAVKKSAAYAMMAAGTLPPAIKITGKAVAWVESEIDAVIQARIAGLDDDAIRALVIRLVADRAKALPVAA